MIELPPALTRNTKVLLVMDVVESVRIMEQDQDGFVRRWQQLVEHAEQQVLPLHGGRIVKSLGDGLMLEFASAQSAVKAAFALHHFSRQANVGLPPEHQMHLRVGGHLASFVTDQHDIYGTDVNLTSRIGTLAGPAETVVTSELRDALTSGLDVDIEDLGECHLKHVEKPVRAYRVGPVGHAAVIPASHTAPPEFRPTIAVIPFEARSNEPEHFVIGELIADGIIAQLSRSPDICVISRLSTTAFRGRVSVMPDVQSRLGASFVLSGSYIASGNKILLMAELADARTNQIVWAQRVSGATDDLLQAQSELLNGLAAATSRALIDAEVERSLVQPLPRLDSSSLLLGGISMMHRSSAHDFDRSRQVLDALIERHGRIATPRAWLAKWYIMRIIRGLSKSPEEDARMALEQTKRALDIEPNNALTLAVEGHAYCQLLGNFDQAELRLTQSIEANPSEPLAWLFKSVASTMWGAPSDAVVEVEYANALSPIDPLKYYFDMLSAAALLTVNDHSRAIHYARQSLKANRHHAPTLRVLLTAQVEANMTEDAQSTLTMLLAETPGMSVSSYLAIGSASSVTRQRCAVALRALGLTEN
ncbi:MAG: adenylate/guanylate cyclase domain-containing protein [Polaromonas sp.]|nr:adenylate/guanylate cyclase domain-containing protein [Polaromonas sp.]MDP3750968.1 adenylate/guanylate cyclase domain-containing protein [Polaromonas sp.]